jgi:hypothetical protein
MKPRRAYPYPWDDNACLTIQLFDEIHLSCLVLPRIEATSDIGVVAESVVAERCEVDRGAVVGLGDRVAGHALPRWRAGLGAVGDVETGAM